MNAVTPFFVPVTLARLNMSVVLILPETKLSTQYALKILHYWD